MRLRHVLGSLLFAAGIFGHVISSHSQPKEVINVTPLIHSKEKSMPGINSNHLIHEKSPYLLQHAHNPVDWYPWGEEAFARARSEEKPVFLSIGYSTCHWCHVMEEQSFENEAIAAILNEHFISIKVDREERPDIDQIYMQAVMLYTGGHGGWPLSVFLTPEGKPFYGGTYFPPEDSWGRPGFRTLLTALAKKWREDRTELLTVGNQLAGALQVSESQISSKLPDVNLLHQAYAMWNSEFDETYGGFGQAPKFPRPHSLIFLLRYYDRTKEPKALTMVTETLKSLFAGGIYDHVGDGFHRYSTDERYHIPHFEKMLYDQALLAIAYLEAGQVTRKPFYGDVARNIFNFVLRDMKSPEGAFYSAWDADSAPESDNPEHKTEGAFYIWSASEIDQELGDRDALLFKTLYGVKADGNALQDPFNEFTGKNILFRNGDFDVLIKKLGWQKVEAIERLATIRGQLFQVREKRPKPHLDDKVLTDWNGLMIAALAYGGQVLDQKDYTRAASDAADFILKELMRDDGRLLHRYREGESRIPGFLEDYAFFTWGLITLYEATLEPDYLEQAVQLGEAMIHHFYDSDQGGFYFTAHDSEKLLARKKDLYDGAIPSGNSVALMVMTRLWHMTGKECFQNVAEHSLKFWMQTLQAQPNGYPFALSSVDFFLGPVQEIVLSGGIADTELRRMHQEVFKLFLPRKVLLHHPLEKASQKRVQDLVPFVKGQRMQEGRATAYVCENFACQLPVTETEELIGLLKKGSSNRL